LSTTTAGFEPSLTGATTSPSPVTNAMAFPSGDGLGYFPAAYNCGAVAASASTTKIRRGAATRSRPGLGLTPVLLSSAPPRTKISRCVPGTKASPETSTPSSVSACVSGVVVRPFQK
jgi:hypothetical protein